MTKRLVVYFSATGAKARMVKSLARIANADIHDIKPKIPYWSQDLNWANPFS